MELKEFSVKMFDATKKQDGTLLLIAELSDFGPGNQIFSRIPFTEQERISGLTIFNPKTGNRVGFFITKVNSNENELQSYELSPTPVSVKKYPKAANMKMILFND